MPAALVRRFLKMSRAEYSADYRLALTERLLLPALRGPTSLNDFSEISLERRKSDGGVTIEFLVLTATSPSD